MAIAVIMQGKDLQPWKKAFASQAGEVPVWFWPDINRPGLVQMALVWKHPAGSLQQFPNLKVVASAGAGVEHIFADPGLPGHVSITRVVDPGLAQGIGRYVAMAITAHQKKLLACLQQQRQGIWRQPFSHEVPLQAGLLGNGQIGKIVARILRELGYEVRTWSRTPDPTDARHFAGSGQLPAFLKNCNVIVCLLPFTPDTAGILNRQLFELCQPGTLLVNVGRGGHLVEADLLQALENGQLSGAWLDVFDQEPLPPAHAFWQHPRVVATPHIASLTNPEKAVAQLLDNYHKMLGGRTLAGKADRQKLY